MVKKEKEVGFGIKLTKSLREPRKKPNSINKKVKITAAILILLAAVVFLTLLVSYFIQLDGPGVKGNLHMHTTYSDGHGSYDEMVDEAVRLGLDFIVITDHGYIKKIGEDVLEKCPKETRLLCIVGEEPAASEGDMLALGITEFIQDKLTPEETIEKTHLQGGLSIPAHPNVPGEISKETLIRIRDKIDAVECYNAKHLREMDFYWLKKFSKTYGIPCVFDSDSHYIGTLGDAYNVCDIEGDINKKNLFDAIKQGRCRPMIKSFVKYSYYTLSKSFPSIRQFALLIFRIIE